jgi:hypothetical protein
MKETTRNLHVTTSETTANLPEPKYPEIPFKEFLESSPALHPVKATGLFTPDGRSFELNAPALTLECEHDSCRGPRFFAYKDKTGGLYRGNNQERNEVFLEYICRNCKTTLKSFSFLVFELYHGGSGIVVKLGEWPPFGPKTPSRLLRLLDSDRDLFLRGRRAECHGLGIGAFTYYRRVVENQKNRLIDEIIKVVNKVEPSPDSIVADLTQAKETFQFSQAMSDVKLAVPQVLLINGHNPLTLLHSVLSAGIHDKSDDECIEIAKNVRLVLVGLAERLGQALSEHRELNDAVTNLLNATKKK